VALQRPFLVSPKVKQEFLKWRVADWLVLRRSNPNCADQRDPPVAGFVVSGIKYGTLSLSRKLAKALAGHLAPTPEHSYIAEANAWNTILRFAIGFCWFPRWLAGWYLWTCAFGSWNRGRALPLRVRVNTGMLNSSKRKGLPWELWSGHHWLAHRTGLASFAIKQNLLTRRRGPNCNDSAFFVFQPVTLASFLLDPNMWI